MSELLVVTLEHGQVNLAGALTFDGRVVEIFGFNDVHSVRLPVELIESAEASFKSGLMSSPMVRFTGRRGSLGYTQVIDPPPEQQPEIEDFCAKVNSAIGKVG